jgi:hypothetical protein
VVSSTDGVSAQMPIDKSYLAKHGPSWRVQVAVPKALQSIVGASVLFARIKEALEGLIRDARGPHDLGTKVICLLRELEPLG